MPTMTEQWMTDYKAAMTTELQMLCTMREDMTGADAETTDRRITQLTQQINMMGA